MVEFLNFDFFTNITGEWPKFALFYMSFWPVLDRKLAAGVTPVTTFFRVFLGGKAVGYRQGRSQGDAQDARAYLLPPCASPPLPSLKGWLWEKGFGSALIYRIQHFFLLRIRIPDPDPGSGSGSRVWWPKIWKNLQLEIYFWFSW